MKHNKISLALLAISVAAFTSCSDDANNKTANSDSASMNMAPTTVDNTTTNTSSTGDYSAYATELETNSASGRYLNPKTGKAYKKLTVNRESGEIMDENNQPVWRYVDNSNWWVYGVDDSDWTWRKMGEAKMDNSDLMYMDDGGKWVNYDTRWKTDDMGMEKTWKTKANGTKIKFGKDGDIKVKDESGKTKYDADDNRIKTDTSKM